MLEAYNRDFANLQIQARGGGAKLSKDYTTDPTYPRRTASTCDAAVE